MHFTKYNIDNDILMSKKDQSHKGWKTDVHWHCIHNAFHYSLYYILLLIISIKTGHRSYEMFKIECSISVENGTWLAAEG